MVQRSVVWSSVVLAGALLAASAPWSQVLQSCSDVPAAQRERMRVAGRCSGQAPIVEVKPGVRGGVRELRRPVPDLRGRPFNARDERLARFLVAIDYKPSPQRRDWVIDQVPRPPASLPEGAGLRVVLSDGALVRVPDVRGDFARALALLYRAGLSWSTGEERAGRVVGQLPAPGAAVSPGTAIALRVAPGALALAPESTRPEVAPPGAPAPSTRPPAAAPPAAPVTSPATAPPASTSPAAGSQALAAMPDLQGMIYDAAASRVAGHNVERVYRAGTEAGGTVIGQSPAAGAPLAPGATVRLVLSDGTLVRVPRVMSFSLNEARQRLVPGEFRVVTANVASDAPAGTIVNQQPAAGDIAKRGTSIRLGVSTGPAAAPAAPAPVAVPNLIGSTLERTQAQLARLRVERSERSAREPVGTILEQTPRPGTTVEPGSTVSVVVSSGGRPEVIELANVVGQTMDAATGRLSEFRIERESVPDVSPAGHVLSQEPAPGTAVPPGSTVRLRVSDGSRVVMPTLAPSTLGQARDAARAAGLAIADDDAGRSPSARVTTQDPAPGTPVARGSAVRLTVESRVLPFDVPPAVRDAWTRAGSFVLQQPARNLAIAIVVLAALLALLLLGRRRTRRPDASYSPIEPVIAADASLTPEPAPPAAIVQPRTSQRSAAPSMGEPGAAPAVSRPAPPASPPLSPPVSPPAPPQRSSQPPPLSPQPMEVRASARLESDPARTMATNAAPRGPELSIAARLEPGNGSVRDLTNKNAAEELSEETK